MGTQERIGIGIIGAGGIAQAHARAYQSSMKGELIAFSDMYLEVARRAADQYGVEALSVDELMKDPRIHAVVICTPPTSHEDLAMEAIRAGKHVLIEKPVTVSLPQADKLIAVAKSRPDLKVMVAHSHRFWPANRKAKELLDRGEIGDILIVKDTILSSMSFEPDQVPWRLKQDVAGGGVVMDNGVHSVDRLRYWLELPCRSVSASTWKTFSGTDVEDQAIAFLRFGHDRNGPAANIQLSFNAPEAAQVCTAEFVGTKGILTVDTWGEIRVCRGDSPWEPVPYQSEPNAFRFEADAFLSSIIEDRPVPVTLEDAKESLRIVHAIYESARTGQAVLL